MDYYSRSNLAYDFSLFEEPQAKGPSARSKDKTRQDVADIDVEINNNDKKKTAKNSKISPGVKRARRRKSNFVRIAIGVILGAVIVFIVVSIIHGQVQLTELNQEIADAKAQLAEQQSVYTQLEMKVDSSISTTVVEEYAKSKLKMSKANNSQKEFINLSDGDKAEVSLSEDKGFFRSIAEAFTSLWS